MWTVYNRNILCETKQDKKIDQSINQSIRVNTKKKLVNHIIIIMSKKTNRKKYSNSANFGFVSFDLFIHSFIQYMNVIVWKQKHLHLPN